MVGLISLRIAQIIPMIWAVATALFILLNLVPGGPVLALSGEFADADTVARIEARLGLDQPLRTRYVNFLSGLASGDLGLSYTYSRPVAQVILDHLPATLILAIPSIFFAAVLGLPLGIFASRNTIWSPVIIGVSLIFFAVPVFWLGHFLRMLPGVSDVLPVQGMTDPRAFHTGLAHWADIARHAYLPCITLTLHQMAYTVLITRRALIAQMRRPYVTTGFAKGASQNRVEWVHALPNGAAPVIALFGNRIGWFLSGAILVEVVFAWPGLGQLVLAAIQNRDTPLVIGVVLTGTIFTILGHLCADVGQALTDPRLKTAMSTT